VSPGTPARALMRVVVHAGLHKSGTTTVQHAFRAGYPADGPVCYPAVDGAFRTGHARLVWPLMAATAANARSHPPERPLAELVRAAEARGAEAFVVSSEELTRIGPGDADRLTEALGGVPDVVLVTVTPPVHRWGSAWAEITKGGATERPADALPHIAATMHLAGGALARYIATLPARRRVVRVVRTDPPEPDLPAAVARCLGLPPPPGIHARLNASPGTRVELVRRLNAAGLPAQPDPDGRHARALALLAPAWRPRPGRRPDPAAWRPPAWLPAAAAAERDFLLAPPDGVTVEDPHGLLPGWAEADPPGWMVALGAHAWGPPFREQPSGAEVRWLVRWYRARRALVTRIGRGSRA